MKKLSAAFVLLLAFGLASCGFDASVNYRDQREERKFTGITSLEIQQDGLDVELTPSQGDTLSVSIRIDEMTVKGLDQEDLEHLESPFNFSEKNGKLTIRLTYGEKAGESRGLIEVKVPHSLTDIEVRSERGDIHAEGLTLQRMKLVSRKGNAAAIGCKGTRDVHVHSAGTGQAKEK